MSLLDHDKTVGYSNLITKISTATGIDNFSNSSVLKIVTKAIHDDIATFTSSVYEAISNTYPETAANQFLDLEGSYYGVYRTSFKSLLVNESDKVVCIKPKNDDALFSSVSQSEITLSAGTEIPLGSQFKLTLVTDAFLLPSKSKQYITARIESVLDAKTLDIKPGDSFKIPSTTSIGNASVYCEMLFEKAISLNIPNESDEDFRSRILFAKNNQTKGTLEAIYNVLKFVPSIYGLTILDASRGRGTADIGITTKMLEETGEDEGIESVLSIARQHLANVAPFGYDIELFVPSNCPLVIQFTSTSVLTTEFIKSAIQHAFYNTYRYSQNNSINIKDLTSFVKSAIPELNDINLVSINALNRGINEMITLSNGIIYAPLDKHLTLNLENISRVV